MRSGYADFGDIPQKELFGHGKPVLKQRRTNFSPECLQLAIGILQIKCEASPFS